MKFLVHFPIFVLLAAAIGTRRVGASSLGISSSSASSLSVSIDSDSTFESNLDSLPESRSDPIEIVVDDVSIFQFSDIKQITVSVF